MGMRAIGRIFSIVITAGGWLLAGARLMLDLIGYSTVPEDFEVAKTRLQKVLDLLLAVPWEAFFVFALISTLWLMWVSWPRPKLQRSVSAGHDWPIAPDMVTADPAHEAPNPEIYYRLFQFSWQRLLEACDAQIALQKAIIEVVADDKLILAHYASLGLEHYPKTEKFWECHSALKIGVETSEPMLKYGALVDLVRAMEKNTYRDFCDGASQLIPGWDLRSNARLRKLWEAWRTKHNALVEEYDNEIKCDPRFGKKLFWPKRESRWGGIIPPLKTGSPKPEDTPTETQR